MCDDPRILTAGRQFVGALEAEPLDTREVARLKSDQLWGLFKQLSLQRLHEVESLKQNMRNLGSLGSARAAAINKSSIRTLEVDIDLVRSRLSEIGFYVGPDQ